MFVISAGLLLALTVSSIFTYIYVCKEKQKKFLIFALPAHIISAVLMIFSIAILTKSNEDRVPACIMNLVAGIVALYLTIVSAVFKHITYGKARKANQN